MIYMGWQLVMNGLNRLLRNVYIFLSIFIYCQIEYFNEFVYGFFKIFIFVVFNDFDECVRVYCVCYGCGFVEILMFCYLFFGFNVFIFFEVMQVFFKDFIWGSFNNDYKVWIEDFYNFFWKFEKVFSGGLDSCVGIEQNGFFFGNFNNFLGDFKLKFFLGQGVKFFYFVFVFYKFYIDGFFEYQIFKIDEFKFGLGFFEGQFCYGVFVYIWNICDYDNKWYGFYLEDLKIYFKRIQKNEFKRFCKKERVIW